APLHVLLHYEVVTTVRRKLFKIGRGTLRPFPLNSTSQNMCRSPPPPRIPDTNMAQTMRLASSNEIDRTRPGLMAVALRHAHIDRKVGAARKRYDMIDGKAPAPCRCVRIFNPSALPALSGARFSRRD